MNIHIDYDQSDPRIRFGVEELVGAAGSLAGGARIALDVTVAIEPGTAAGSPESFRVSTGTDGAIRIAGSDGTGAMYGCLELADRIRADGSAIGLSEIVREPRLEFRATKLNLPWSSYRRGEVMSRHEATMKTHDFWATYIDMLARNRFNALTIWNLHPFPYMIRPKRFPEACPFSDAELARWRELWRFIFRRCRERGVAAYIVDWNIHVPPSLEEAWGISYREFEYHIGPGDASERVKEYNRECITQVIDEYEDLAGIGVSLGERMENLDAHERERWIEEVVFAGMKAASRPAQLIHRAPFTADPAEVRRAIEGSGLETPVWVEYKFNWSHGHSTPKLSLTHDVGHNADKPKIDDRYWNPPPTHHKMVWMVRNEDIFVLRWGEPDFIRAHIRENAHNYTGGYIVGSEGHIPADDLADRHGHPRPWRYGFEKQWLFYRLWGRLLYHPDEPDETFEADFRARHGDDVGAELLAGFRHGSRMPLRLASFHAETWDYTIYSEGFISPFKRLGFVGSRDPFISIDEFIAHPTLDDQLLSIPDFVHAGLAGVKLPGDKVTPIRLAERCDADGERALVAVGKVRSKVGYPDSCLVAEIADVEVWGHLSRYLAAKLRAGVALHRFRAACDPADKDLAVAELTTGLELWREVVRITSERYVDVPYIDRSEYGYEQRFHWRFFTHSVAGDLRVAEHAQAGVFPYPERWQP